ncbi:hypothetical protein GCK32_003668 [Trichostrongylus colubriformis]|uniref:V-type proton ATPase subunit F n=1 Tax=Trichostrongylus colubriformis TaxID=6319 RepID=A0AAN8EZU8_TRICO
MASAIKGKILAVIGDEDTVVGFLLGGVGELNKARKPNYLIVDKQTGIAGPFSSTDFPHVRTTNGGVRKLLKPRTTLRIVARTWIELEIVCEERSVAFVRRVWLKTDRRRGATHPHVE